VSDILPLEVHGAEVSYFTGKIEGVLRYKELPYTRVSNAFTGDMVKETGIAQMPAIKLADGRWMTDTTPMIAWLDAQFPETALTPADPALRFFSLLVEDFADEWQWRPAMHYRWDNDQGRTHISRVLADELARHIRAPGFLVRRRLQQRQIGRFTKGDGVTATTWDHVEKIYLDALDYLTVMLDTRPYMLGDRPSLADYAFFGPFFRHYGMDPEPSRIMREQAPAVYEWVARLWNARASRVNGPLLETLPEDWAPILNSIGSAYLPYLCDNAQAFMASAKELDFTVEGVTYRNVRTSRYRVWCLERLRAAFDTLPEEAKPEVETVLKQHGCWEPLWRVPYLTSGVDPDGTAPFYRGYSMTGFGE